MNVCLVNKYSFMHSRRQTLISGFHNSTAPHEQTYTFTYLWSFINNIIRNSIVYGDDQYNIIDMDFAKEVHKW